MNKMNEYGMIVDLAHSSHALMSDILELDDSQRKLLCFYETTTECTIVIIFPRKRKMRYKFF